MECRYFNRGALICTLLIFLFSFNTSAQVGIGTTNPNSNAKLDITSTVAEPGGLLLPRLALTAINNINPLPGPASELRGMAVYNTATAGSGGNQVTPGFYYHNGSVWVRIAAASLPSDDWTTTGNAGLNANNNFLGTTDNIALRFRTNDADRFEITSGNAASRGRLRSFENGTEAQPTYSWAPNIGTGMFQQGAGNIIGFSTAGVERFRIPNANQVHAMSDGTAALPFYSWNGDTDIGMYRQAANILGFSTNQIERLRLSATEAVFNDGGSNYNFRVASAARDNMFFINAAANRIGINTNTPANVIDFRSTGENIWLTYWENNHASNGGSGQFIHTNANNGNRVLMGATNYTGSANAASAVIGLSLGGSGFGGIGVNGFSNSPNGTGVYGGFVGRGWFGSGWAIYADGNAGGTTGWQNFSDKRLKRDIKTLNGSLSKVLQLRGVEYYYDITSFPDVNLDTQSKQIGFVAQEVESIFPNLVRDSNLYSSPQKEESSISETRNTYIVKSLSYTDLIPVLVEAIKEQETIIESQEIRISKLESLVQQLLNK